MDRRVEDEATFVVVGGGIAGVSCAEILSVLCPSEKIILLTSSPVIKAVANLSHLTKLLAAFDVQEETAADFESKHKNLKVIVSPCHPVTRVNPATKTVETSGGKLYGYGLLCLCHGARPKLINESSTCPYVLGIRDTESVRQFQERLSGARRIVIVGNGGIATEMVHELESVDIVWSVKDDAIAANFIDAGCAEFFSSSINRTTPEEGGGGAGSDTVPVKRHKYSVFEAASSIVTPSTTKSSSGGGALGPDWHYRIATKGLKNSDEGKKVQVEYGTEIQSLSGDRVKFRPEDFEEITIYNEEDERSWNVYVELTNGKVVGCDFVVSATGVQPNGDSISIVNEGETDQSFHISHDGGIVVNEQMETNVEGIYAAGDVCHAGWVANRDGQLDSTPSSKHWFQMRLWTQARQMGLHAGQCMQVAWESQGEEKRDLDFSFEMFAHSTKFFGFKVVLLGLFNAQGMDQADYEVLLRVTKGKEYVKAVMSKDGRMQGALLVGETDLEETFENLILNQMDLSAFGVDLLDPNIDIEDYFD